MNFIEYKKEDEPRSSSFFLFRLKSFLFLLLLFCYGKSQGNFELKKQWISEYRSARTYAAYSHYALSLEQPIFSPLTFLFSSQTHSFFYSKNKVNELFLSLNSSHFQTLTGLRLHFSNQNLTLKTSPDLKSNSISLSSSFHPLSLSASLSYKPLQWDFEVWQKAFENRDTLRFSQQNNVLDFNTNTNVNISRSKAGTLGTHFLTVKTNPPDSGYSLLTDIHYSNYWLSYTDTGAKLFFRLKAAYHLLKVSNQGMRYRSGDIKRFHFAQTQPQLWSLAAEVRLQDFPQLTQKFEYGEFSGSLKPSVDSKKNRTEFLALNRLYPADLWVIIGSSWLKKSVEIDAQLKGMFLHSSSKYTFLFNKRLDIKSFLNLWYATGTLNVNAQTIDDQLFFAKKTEHLKNFDAQILIAQLQSSAQWKISRNFHLFTILSQWVPLFINTNKETHNKLPSAQGVSITQGLQSEVRLQWLW